MRLLFKQRFLSWFDSYDIYDEEGRTAYTVEGKLSWGHRLEIYGPAGDHLGTVKEEVLTLLPRFALYAGEEYLGCIRKEFALFHPRFTLDCNGWEVEGSFLEWDYAVTDPAGRRWRPSTRSCSTGPTPMCWTSPGRRTPCCA